MSPEEILTKANQEYDNMRYFEAEKLYQRYLTLFERQEGGAAKMSLPYHRLGLIAYKRQQIETAQDYLIKAIKTDTQKNPQITLDYAIILFDIGEYERAKNFFSYLSKNHPELGEARSYLAQTLLNLDPNETILPLLEEEYGRMEACRLIAERCREMGKIDEALRLEAIIREDKMKNDKVFFMNASENVMDGSNSELALPDPRMIAPPSDSLQNAPLTYLAQADPSPKSIDEIAPTTNEIPSQNPEELIGLAGLSPVPKMIPETISKMGEVDRSNAYEDFPILSETGQDGFEIEFPEEEPTDDVTVPPVPSADSLETTGGLSSVFDAMNETADAFPAAAPPFESKIAESNPAEPAFVESNDDDSEGIVDPPPRSRGKNPASIDSSSSDLSLGGTFRGLSMGANEGDGVNAAVSSDSTDSTANRKGTFHSSLPAPSTDSFPQDDPFETFDEDDAEVAWAVSSPVPSSQPVVENRSVAGPFSSVTPPSFSGYQPPTLPATKPLNNYHDESMTADSVSEEDSFPEFDPLSAPPFIQDNRNEAGRSEIPDRLENRADQIIETAPVPDSVFSAVPNQNRGETFDDAVEWGPALSKTKQNPTSADVHEPRPQTRRLTSEEKLIQAQKAGAKITYLTPDEYKKEIATRAGNVVLGAKEDVMKSSKLTAEQKQLLLEKIEAL